MMLTIDGLLSSEDLAQVEKDLKLIAWRDGAETAGAVARAVKKNEQADLSSRGGVRLRELLSSRIEAHPVLQAFARPAIYSNLLISRTRNGGGYGLHVDNPFMRHGSRSLRTDLSFTLFLSPPDSYEGGELSIELSGVTHQVKGEPGDVVIYPSTTLHGVAPVTSGERIVCVGWIESTVRSGDQREMLFDLENLRAELLQSHDPNSAEMLMLAKTTANLKRMWVGQ